MSEQVKHCMDLEHFIHWLHLEPTHLIATICFNPNLLSCGKRRCV
jgi:desulfoferrodoxin (superoxide reductase-like protein)